MDALEDSILDESIGGDAGKQTHEPADPAPAFELDLNPEDQGSAGAAEENPD